MGKVFQIQSDESNESNKPIKINMVTWKLFEPYKRRNWGNKNNKTATGPIEVEKARVDQHFKFTGGTTIQIIPNDTSALRFFDPSKEKRISGVKEEKNSRHYFWLINHHPQNLECERVDFNLGLFIKKSLWLWHGAISSSKACLVKSAFFIR